MSDEEKKDPHQERLDELASKLNDDQHKLLAEFEQLHTEEHTTQVLHYQEFKVHGHDGGKIDTVKGLDTAMDKVYEMTRDAHDLADGSEENVASVLEHLILGAAYTHGDDHGAKGAAESYNKTKEGKSAADRIEGLRGVLKFLGYDERAYDNIVKRLKEGKLEKSRALLKNLKESFKQGYLGRETDAKYANVVAGFQGEAQHYLTPALTKLVEKYGAEAEDKGKQLFRDSAEVAQHFALAAAGNYEELAKRGYKRKELESGLESGEGGH